MPKKSPESHVTAGKGLAGLTRTLFDTWIVRKEDGSADYGFDATIELREGDVATALRFGVQLKSTAGFDTDPPKVSLTIDDIEHLSEGTLPAIVVAYDVGADELRWDTIEDIVAELDRTRDDWRSQDSVTVPLTRRRAELDAMGKSHLAQRVPALSASVRTLPSRPDEFVNRDEAFAKLRKDAKIGGAKTIHVLCGAAGIGKTALSVEYAYRHFAEYVPTYLNAAEAAFEKQLRNLVRRSSLSRPRLIVIDNAIDVEAILAILGSADKVHVLILTRECHDQQPADVTRIRLSALSNADAERLLVLAAGPPPPEGARALIGFAQGSPLALRLMSVVARDRGWNALLQVLEASPGDNVRAVVEYAYRSLPLAEQQLLQVLSAAGTDKPVPLALLDPEIEWPAPLREKLGAKRDATLMLHGLSERGLVQITSRGIAVAPVTREAVTRLSSPSEATHASAALATAVDQALPHREDFRQRASERVLDIARSLVAAESGSSQARLRERVGFVETVRQHISRTRVFLIPLSTASRDIFPQIPVSARRSFDLLSPAEFSQRHRPRSWLAFVGIDEHTPIEDTRVVRAAVATEDLSRIQIVWTGSDEIRPTPALRELMVVPLSTISGNTFTSLWRAMGIAVNSQIYQDWR